MPLDRDVLFLVEAGEECSTGVGIGYVVQQHYPAIDAEYCFAEGGNVTRVGGQVKFAAIQALEKVSRGIELTAVGPSGHGAAPLAGMAIVELSKAVAALGSWRVPFLFNDTRREFFRLVATVSSPAAARDSFQKNEPRYASMLHTSISPTIITGGYRSNVIPSEAKATLDVRMMPDEDPAAFLAAVQQVINNPAVTARYTSNTSRPVPPPAKLDSDAFKVVQSAIARNKGMQCFGIGPAADLEDAAKGFAAHSDQERTLEAEIYRFVRFSYEIVYDLARKH